MARPPATRCRSSPLREGKFTTQYSRTFVEAAQKLADDPAPHRRPGRGARSPGPGLRRARLRDGAPAGRHPAPEQPRRRTTGAPPTRTPPGRGATGCSCASGWPRPTAARCPRDSRSLWGSIQGGRGPRAASRSPRPSAPDALRKRALPAHTHALVRGRYVITGVHQGRASVDRGRRGLPARRGHRRGGAGRRAGPSPPGPQTLGSPDHVVLPGFVNGHHHVGLTPVQLGSPDMPLELWFVTRMVMRNVNLYLDTLYSAFEMIASGITTVQHLHGWMPGALAGRRDAAPTRDHPRLRGCRHARVATRYAVRDQNRLVYQADEEFVPACRRSCGADAALVRPLPASASTMRWTVRGPLAARSITTSAG